jgi:hypothetical protein
MDLNTLGLIQDILSTFVLPIICLISLLSNILNVVVLLRLESNSKIYKYMLLKSIINSFYLFACSFLFLFKCGQFCSDSKYSYLVKLYQLYIFNYLTSCLGLLDLFIELIICFNRYAVVSKEFHVKDRNNQITRKGDCVILVLITFTFLFYIPNIITQNIIPMNLANNTFTNNVTEIIPNKYKIALNPNFKNLYAIFEPVNIYFRGFLMIGLIIFVRILASRRFKTNVDDLLLATNYSTTFNKKLGKMFFF